MNAVLEFWKMRWKLLYERENQFLTNTHHITAPHIHSLSSVDCWCLLFVKWKLENSSENRSWESESGILKEVEPENWECCCYFSFDFTLFGTNDTRNENLRFFNLIRLDRKPQKWSNSSRLWTLSNVEWHSIKEDGSTCAIINWIHSRAKSSWKFHAPLCSRVFNSISSRVNGFDLDGKFLELWQLHVQSQSLRYWINLTTIRFVSLPLYRVSIFFTLLWCLMSKLFMIVEWNDMRAEKRSKHPTDDSG